MAFIEKFKLFFLDLQTVLLELVDLLFQNKKKIFFTVFTAGSLFMVLLFGSVYIHYRIYKPDYEKELERYKLWLSDTDLFPDKPTVLIYANDKTLIGEYYAEQHSRMSLNRCANLTWLKRAAVSAEDQDFYHHRGLSYRGILRALINNILSLRFREGASSITQQVAKNVFLPKGIPDIIRKAYEFYFVRLIEKHLTKDETLCLYLNKIYMGEGRYGAEQASQFYFRKPPEELGPVEAGMIVGLFPSPVYYSPLYSIERSMKKTEMVLSALARDKFLKEENQEKLLESFIKKYQVVNTEEEESPGTIGIYGANRYFRLNLAPDVNEYVRQFLLETIPEEELLNGNLRVYTTIDPIRQSAALSAIRSGVEKIRKESQFPETLTREEKRKILHANNGVFLSVEPYRAEILAMVGGYNISEDEYSNNSRIWKMLRQPGSSIKGLLYALALETGTVTPESVVRDEKINYGGYSPANWYDGYLGDISIQEAVAKSVNTIAVTTLKQMGVSHMRDALTEITGAPSSRFASNLSLALGSGEVTPMELVKIYAGILNGGTVIQPYLIERIEDSEGQAVYDHSPPLTQSRFLSEDAATDAVTLLQSPVTLEGGTAEWIGRYLKKNQFDFEVAAKTGTVQSDAAIQKKFPGMKGVHDAWFVAMVPDEVNVIWFGNDLGAPFPGGGSGSGGSAWLNYAATALKGRVSGKLPRKRDSFFQSIFSWRKKEKQTGVEKEANGVAPPSQGISDPFLDTPPSDQPD